MRRVLLVVLLLAVASGVGYVLLQWNPQRIAGTDPWRAVPTEAAVIIEVPDAMATWDRFAHTSLLWRAWEAKPAPRGLAQRIAQAARAFENDAALKQLVGKPTVIIALLRAGSSVADPLFLGSSEGAPAEKVGALLGVDAGAMSAFHEGRIVACDPDSSGGVLHACLRKGIWMASPSATAIDEALVQLDRGTPITADPLFTKARATLGQATEAHVLVNTARAGSILSGIWEPERIDRLALPRGWLALDLGNKPDALLLNGLLVPEGNDAWVGSMHAQGAGAWNIARLIPADAVQFELHNVGSSESAMQARGNLDERTRATEAVAEWMRGTIGVSRGSADGRRWFVAEAADPERAAEELNAPCADAVCDTLHHRGSRITRMLVATPYELLLGRATILPQQAWWTMLGRHVVMSDDPAALRSSIDVWLDGGSLAEQPAARAWFKGMGDEAAFTWWCDPVRGGELFRNGLNASRTDGFNAWLPVLNGISAASLQLSPAPGGMVHVAIGIQHAQSIGNAASGSTGSDVLWQCAVGAPVQRMPDLVRNHVSNTWEVLVQDTAHRIHLISATGKLLWSRQLDGRLLGTVRQVDRFKNGKLQLLMGTAKQLHLIDRNGKDVGVPLALPSEATAPLAVFDYEGTHEYRVLVPVADGRLLNIDLDWASVQGWTTPRLEARAVDAVRHLRIAGKDHLMTVDAEGAVRLFDRKGNAREAVAVRMPSVKAVLAVEPGQQVKATRVIWIDQDLMIHAVRLDGAGAEELPGTDLNGDGWPDLTVEGGAAPARANTAIATGGVLALAERDAATGLARHYATSAQRAPAGMAQRWALGDLNLDGARELVGSDGPAVIAYRLPAR
ncbi:MAG TPA: hypothetical protein PKY96_09175 [Flavobacteriales bacterium]|nr:hypothetical protein [Flavobacteriales bacterium]